MKVLDGSAPVQAVPGVELIPAPWPNKHPVTDLVGLRLPRNLSRLTPSALSWGMGPSIYKNPNPDDPKLIGLERLEEKIRAGMIHYVALGDRHSTTDVGATGRVWYAGAPEPTAYVETDPGNVLLG